jgi:hypothetical protein
VDGYCQIGERWFVVLARKVVDGVQGDVEDRSGIGEVYSSLIVTLFVGRKKSPKVIPRDAKNTGVNIKHHEVGRNKDDIRVL